VLIISTWNAQNFSHASTDMEDPFDQVGLDDIKLEEFHFAKEDSFIEKPAP